MSVAITRLAFSIVAASKPTLLVVAGLLSASEVMAETICLDEDSRCPTMNAQPRNETDHSSDRLKRDERRLNQLLLIQRYRDQSAERLDRAVPECDSRAIVSGGVTRVVPTC